MKTAGQAIPSAKILVLITGSQSKFRLKNLTATKNCEYTMIICFLFHLHVYKYIGILVNE